MEPSKGNSSLRKVRTFADDVRRAQGETIGDTGTLTKATSIVAPTITARSSGPASATLETKVSGKGFFGGTLDGSLLDIRNAEKGTEEATIVTERKVKQWSFTDAITESFLSWWKETLAEFKTETHEAPRVAPSGKRTAIVRAASMNAPIAPKDDGALFAARLKATGVAPVATPPTAPIVEAAPKWGSVEQPVVAVVADAPAQAVFSSVPKIARPVIRPPIIAPKHIEPVVNDAPIFREYSSAPVDVPLQAQREAPLETLQTSEDTAVESPDNSIQLREEAIRAESARFAAKAREAAQRRKEYETEGGSGASYSKYFVYGALSLVGIFVIIAIAGVGYSLFNSRNTSTAVAPTPGISMLFDVSESIAVPLLNNRTDFLVDLTKRVKEATGAPGSFLRYYFVYQSDSSKKELPSQAFLDTLDLRAPGSFLRTIDEKMMFGAYIGEAPAPFLVFKVKNFEDALGGMLLFERNMNGDLAPLFGDNLERIGQTGVFRDEVVGGIDTRSLYDPYGNMIITYAFIDKQTLVITTSYNALGALAQVLK